MKEVVCVRLLLLKDSKLFTNPTIQFLLQLKLKTYKAAKNQDFTTEYYSASGKL